MRVRGSTMNFNAEIGTQESERRLRQAQSKLPCASTSCLQNFWTEEEQEPWHWCRAWGDWQWELVRFSRGVRVRYNSTELGAWPKSRPSHWLQSAEEWSRSRSRSHDPHRGRWCRCWKRWPRWHMHATAGDCLRWRCRNSTAASSRCSVAAPDRMALAIHSSCWQQWSGSRRKSSRKTRCLDCSDYLRAPLARPGRIAC